MAQSYSGWLLFDQVAAYEQEGFDEEEAKRRAVADIVTA